MCPSSVVLLYRLPDGRLLPKRVPCGTRACEVCGPRLQRRRAQEWAHVMGGDAVGRLVVTEREWVRLRRQKVMRGQEWATIPQLGGVRVVYTTADLGPPLANGGRATTLLADLAAMPLERRTSMSKGWLAVLGDLEAEAEARRQDLGECLGRCRRSLEQIEIVARELGLYLGPVGSDGLLVADPGDQWGRFASLIGLVRGRPQRRAAA